VNICFHSLNNKPRPPLGSSDEKALNRRQIKNSYVAEMVAPGLLAVGVRSKKSPLKRAGCNGNASSEGIVPFPPAPGLPLGRTQRRQRAERRRAPVKEVPPTGTSQYKILPEIHCALGHRHRVVRSSDRANTVDAGAPGDEAKALLVSLWRRVTSVRGRKSPGWQIRCGARSGWKDKAQAGRA